MRKITVIVSATNTRHTFDTDVTTLGQFKRLLEDNGINTENQSYYEGVSKTELLNDDSVLPTNIPYKGRIENNLVIMMTTENKKIKSGCDRKELYVIIRDNKLQDAIKEHFHTPYTNVKTAELDEFISDVLDTFEDDEEHHCNCSGTNEETEQKCYEELDALVKKIIKQIIGNTTLLYAAVNGICFGCAADELHEMLKNEDIDKKEVPCFTEEEIVEMFNHIL